MTTGDRPLIPRLGMTVSVDDPGTQRTQPWDGHNLNALEDILRVHYLAQIVCDHEAKTDHAVCACSLIDLGVYPSVGQAVQSHVDHVMAEIRGKWSLDSLLRRAERVDV